QPYPPTMTSAEPSISCPTPPQCWSVSPIRCAGLLLTITVPEPFTAFQVFGPQHTAWMPLSPTRRAGLPLMFTFGEPAIAGPTAGCGHARQPCAHAGTFDLSPNRPAPGISQPP